MAFRRRRSFRAAPRRRSFSRVRRTFSRGRRSFSRPPSRGRSSFSRRGSAGRRRRYQPIGYRM